MESEPDRQKTNSQIWVIIYVDTYALLFILVTTLISMFN